MSNEQNQSEARAHPVDPPVMLSELTMKDVDSFEFIGITPARGKAYYGSDLDVAVIDYGDYMRVYYDRVIDHGKTASSFNKSIINRTT